MGIEVRSDFLNHLLFCSHEMFPSRGPCQIKGVCDILNRRRRIWAIVVKFNRCEEDITLPLSKEFSNLREGQLRATTDL